MFNLLIKDFQKAINRLEEVLKLKKTELTRDAAIKRFELCFDLAWKSIKSFAKEQGLECYSPKECFKVAFQLALIEHDTKWLQLLKDRNLIVHLYKEEEADKVYSKLPDHLGLFKKLQDKLKEK